MQIMDEITYTFETEGIRDFDYSFESDLEKVISVHVNNDKSKINMTLTVVNVYDGDDLTEFNEYFIKWAVSFGFELDVPIWELKISSYSLPKRGGSRNTKIYAGPITFKLPVKSKCIDQQQIENIEYLCSSVGDEELMLLRLFSFANSEREAISRYSYLYNVMLQICGDKQANVDMQIMDIKPSTVQTVSPKNGKYETIYTRLRNELAHKRDGVS
jgi:hypothetical protein